jgi:hypothetical protein
MLFELETGAGKSLVLMVVLGVAVREMVAAV